MFEHLSPSLAIPCMALLGATLMMLVYHLILYRQYREMIILKYCIYLLVISLYLVADLAVKDQWSLGTTKGMVLLVEAFNFLVILAYAAFIIQSLEISLRRYARLYRAWRWLAGIMAIYIGFLFFLAVSGLPTPEALFNILTNTLRVALTIFGMVASILLFAAAKGPFLNCIKWGAILYLLFMVLVMITMYLVPDNRLLGLSPMHFVYIGTLTDVVIFSIGMSFKIKELYFRVSEIRNQLSRDLHDEIGATLSGVRLMSELVKSRINTGDPAELENYMDRITAESKLMAEKLNEIVWMADTKNDSLERILFRLQSYASGICAAQNISLHMQRARGTEHTIIDGRTRNNIYLICKEAINNAAKYSAAKNIWFNLVQEGDQLRISVTDDGKGFNGGHTIGNGLQNMRTRAQEIGADLDIQSSDGSGTSIILAF